MTPDEFWLAINEARNHATTDTKIPSLLEAQLAKESLAHIVSFEEQLHARFNEAYDAKLWVAAGVILGNCSDDSFTDFRGWLIAQGRDVFLAAVRYSDTLANIVRFTGDDGAPRLFYLCYTPTRVYRQKLGNKFADIPIPYIRPQLRNSEVRNWDDQQIQRSLPRLSARFRGLK